MKALSRRLCRLEHQLAPVRGPLQRFRIVVRGVDRKPSLEGATCTRTGEPGGTVTCYSTGRPRWRDGNRTGLGRQRQNLHDLGRQPHAGGQLHGEWGFIRSRGAADMQRQSVPPFSRRRISRRTASVSLCPPRPNPPPRKARCTSRSCWISSTSSSGGRQ